MSKRHAARRRSNAPIKKPFPVGFTVGCVALAAALIGILVYAFQNQGIGDRSSLKYAQSHVDGIKNVEGLRQNHVEGQVDYPAKQSAPPVGGDHNGTPQTCQVYSQPIASEHAVHALEHGAAWVTYDPGKLSATDVAKLKQKVDGNPYRLMSPYPGLKSAVSLQAWGEQLFVDRVSDKRIDQFLDLFTQGPQPQERGAACQGTTSASL